MAARVFSGIQPTGRLHLGNYLGAVRSWARLQAVHSNVTYCIVDLHALTAAPKAAAGAAEARRADARSLAAALLAAGVDPGRGTLYVQSAVPAHSELAWLLACRTPLGWLNVMTQYKEKRGDLGALLGLYSYPVLMAADILAFRATHVPVGADQLQHLELARTLAAHANTAYGVDLFPLPLPLLSPHERVMSLRDPERKMSKSDPSERSRILLEDPPDEIRRKVLAARTDSIDGISWDPENRPGLANLLRILSAVSDLGPPEAIADALAARSMLQLKEQLVDALVQELSPVRKRFLELDADHDYIRSVLRDGAERARAVSEATMADVRDAVGLWPV